MADSTRPRRATAGRNIGKVLNQELGGDDFYSTTYGGFSESSEDEEYESEASEDDKIDSDFDVDETEWGPDEGADEKIRKEEKKATKQVIKPYRPSAFSQQAEPPKPPRKSVAQTVTLSLAMGSSSTSTTSAAAAAGTSEQRTFRKSTQEVSRGFRKRREEEELMKRKRTVRRSKPVRRLTQEELLEEAKWTELENLASLEAYFKMVAAEKMKVKERKVNVFKGPVVRYLSVTMPVVEGEVGEGEGEGEAGERVEVVDDDDKPGVGESVVGEAGSGDSRLTTSEDAAVVAMETDDSGSSSIAVSSVDGKTVKSAAPPDVSPATQPMSHPQQQQQQQQQQQKQQKQSRNFMVFTDSNNFPSGYFPSVTTKPARPRRRLCPVTGLPAKYIDPLTHTPYATPFAFKVIRMRYVSEAEEKCEKRLIQLSNWLQEKKKKKMEAT